MKLVISFLVCAGAIAQTRVRADQLRNCQQTYFCVDGEPCEIPRVTHVRLSQLNLDSPLLVDPITLRLAFAAFGAAAHGPISNVCWINDDGRIECLTEESLFQFRWIPWFASWLKARGR